jgi:cytochrome b561
MAVQAERALNPLAHACSSRRILIVLFGCAAILVVAIGVLGLLHGSWLRQLLESWINIHPLFGLLLGGLVLARYESRVRHAPCVLPADVRELSRHLSRIVYLLLYLVIGVRQSIVIMDSTWHGSVVDFNLFDERFLNGPDRAGWNPKDDFQLFLATGLSVLLILRVVTFRLWLRAVERGALAPPFPTGLDNL